MINSPNVDITFEYTQQLTELSKMCSTYKSQIELANTALIGQHFHWYRNLQTSQLPLQTNSP